MPPNPPSSSSSSSSHPHAGPSLLTLSNQTMARLKPAKIFKNAVEAPPPPPANMSMRPQTPVQRSITGICFDDKGDKLVTAADDETFKVYDCRTGKFFKSYNSKKYGVDLPRFTHKNTAIIHASTKEDDAIRYHSLHDNKYLQYYKGHKERVTSLEMSPIDDGFISGSLDKTVRLWDLRAPACRGMLNLPSYPVVAYDSTGTVFAVAVNHYSRILLYDQANYDKAPFHTILLDDPSLSAISYPPRPIYVTSMSFSSNGKYLLVGCSGDAHYILDAFDGTMLAKCEGYVGLERRSIQAPPIIEAGKGISGEEVSWTPDSKYVVGGSLDGRVMIWDVQNLHQLVQPRGAGGGGAGGMEGEVRKPSAPTKILPMATLEGHPGPARCVRFNPRYGMLATAGHELAFWLSDAGGDPEDVAKELLKKRTS